MKMHLIYGFLKGVRNDNHSNNNYSYQLVDQNKRTTGDGGLMSSRLRLPEGVDGMTAEEYQQRIAPKEVKPSKYKSILTNVDGLTFHSKREANRYCQLKIMLDRRIITDFQRQVKYVLLSGVKGMFREKYYKADFVITYPTGEVVVEDVKGVITPVYALKKHLMYEKYKILIKEV